MILTTTNNIEGKTIVAYQGIVTGEAVMGTNMFRDMFARIRDVVGGRSGAYEKELAKGRLEAFKDLTAKAEQMSANAVVGIDIDYEVVGDKGSMLMVSVNGTAVIIE